MNSRRTIIKGIFLSFIFILFFGFFISGLRVFFIGSISEGASNNSISDSQNILLPQEDLENLESEINAESAIVLESDLSGPEGHTDKIIFEKNSELKLPIASLTKLMTAVISLNNYDLLKKITISKEADLQQAMKTDLKLGDVFSTADLLYIMLIESSNKAAYALSEQVGEKEFVALMNQRAKELGLKNTFYADPTGLSSENVSTAEDLTGLAKYILKNYPEIAQISRTKEYDVPNFGKIINTNQLLGEIPEIIGGKTGFTTDAKGCLLLVVYNPKGDDYLIYIILGADDRFSEMKKLINLTNQ